MPHSAPPKHLDDWHPYKAVDGYLMFGIPSQCWSGEQYAEDEIKLTYFYGDDHWSGCTEMDQSIKRDLDDEQIAQIVEEFGLARYVEENRPYSVAL